jgi:DNA-binding cell septation regulator SpoVG
MKIIRMNPLKGESKSRTAAFLDVQTNDGIILKGFRLVNGSNGMFLSAPDEKGKDGKFYEKVILPSELKGELEKMAIEEFNQMPK